MVRFPCFNGQVHSDKPKKAVLSMDSMQKTLEDCVQNQALNDFNDSSELNSLNLKAQRDAILNSNANHVMISSIACCWKSEEINSKYNVGSNRGVSHSGHIKKSLSLGSGLDRAARTSVGKDSDNVTELGTSLDGFHQNNGMVVSHSGKNLGISVPNQCLKMRSFKAIIYHRPPTLYGRGLFCARDLSTSTSHRLTASPSLSLSTRPTCWCSHSRRFSSLDHKTFMEVVKAVARHSSASCERIAVRADRKSYTYDQLISSAWRISRLLCDTDLKTVDCTRGNDHLGGARIGIVAKPSAEFVAGILGTWFSGGVAVPLALSYPEAELLHVMNDSDVSMILSTEDHSELMQNVAAKSDAQFSLIPAVPSIPSRTAEIDKSKNGEMDVDRILEGFDNSNKIQGEDPALILYTSGTTGKPKGVVHTHQGILAQAQMLTNAWEYTSADQFLYCLPLHHVHGLFNALLAPLYAGSSVEFIPKFSVRGIWQRWRESYPEDGTKADDAITVFTGVPTMYTRLIQGYEAMERELQKASASAAGKLRLMMCGSSALPFPVMQQWDTITGHRLLERYGMTEFVMALSNPLRGARKGGTVGKPFPGVQAKILMDDGSVDDTTGVGELCIKSPSLFKEYWKLPEVTKESFIDGGFFKTGDAVKVDEDGYYVILGRTSADIMKVGGYKLSALEIESALLEHPVVSECCVLGLPDKDYGEAVCAIVVPEAEMKKKREEELKPALSLEELCTWAKDRLAPYKLPTRLFLWGTLPRNAMGKVNKKELKKVLAVEGQ